MSDDVAALPRPRAGIYVAGACAVGIGMLFAAFGLAGLAITAGAASVAAAAARPREAALATALAAPLNNIVVLHTPVLDLRFTQVLWLTILLSVFARWLARKPLPMTALPRWLLLMLGGLVAWHVTSALVNGNGVRSFVKIAQIGGFAIILWMLAAMFATIPIRERAAFLRVAVRVAVLLLVFSTAYFLFKLDWPMLVDISQSEGVRFLPAHYTVQEALTGVTVVRMSAFDLSVVSTASLVAGLLGVAYAAGMTARSREDRRWGWTLFWVCAGVLLLTFSRAGWLVGALVVMLVAWRIGTRQLIAVVAALAVAVGALFLVPAVRGRLAEFSDPTEASTAIHFQLWETAIGFANEKPVFGGGPYSFVERTRRSDESDQPAHNFVLEAAADTGWVGAGLTLAFVLALLRFGWTRLRHAPPLAFALWTGLLGAVLMNLTMNGFREDMWWVWAAMVVAVGIQVDAAKRAASDGEAACASS